MQAGLPQEDLLLWMGWSVQTCLNLGPNSIALSVEGEVGIPKLTFQVLYRVCKRRRGTSVLGAIAGFLFRLHKVERPGRYLVITFARICTRPAVAGAAHHQWMRYQGWQCEGAWAAGWCAGISDQCFFDRRRDE